jgi:hypothetical protein
MMTLNHILLPLILLAFPHGLPDHRLIFQFIFLTAPPQVHEPSIPSTISLPICEPLSISPTSYRNSPMGPPPFVSFHDISASPGAFILHWGTRFCILYVFPRMYLLYKHLYLTVIYLRRHHWRPAFLLATCNPCHPWLEHCFSFIITGIVYIFRVLPRSLILYPLTLLTLSRLWHNLPRILSYPNGCGHALSHASSNQGQSRVIPLCDFVSVPLPPHHISRFHGVPLCFSESRLPFVDISTLFQKGDSILILISHLSEGSRTAQAETP